MLFIFLNLEPSALSALSDLLEHLVHKYEEDDEGK